MSHTAPDGKPATYGEDQEKGKICEKCSDVMAEEYIDYKDMTLCAQCHYEVTKNEQ